MTDDLGDRLANYCVALRKESVDRNVVGDVMGKGLAVALRKESVDRNVIGPLIFSVQPRSLSARRAWIEMHMCHRVDRVKASLSARRAWIEIFYYADNDADWVVALRKESVDRNNLTVHERRCIVRRSPQGERG